MSLSGARLYNKHLVSAAVKQPQRSYFRHSQALCVQVSPHPRNTSSFLHILTYACTLQASGSLGVASQPGIMGCNCVRAVT